MKTLLNLFLLACCLLTGAQEPGTYAKIVATGTPESGKLVCGESAELTLYGENLPPEAKFLLCEVFENGKKVENAQIPANEKFIVRKTMNQPGWLAALITVCDAEGKPIPNPRPANVWDKVFKRGIGCLFSPEKIQPALPPPKDFEEFWKKQREELNRVPMVVKRSEVEVAEQFRDRGKCYAVEISCAGAKPVRGYLSIPHTATAKSMPLVVFPHGAGVRSANMPVWRRGNISFEFNAHGIENGREPSYYDEQLKTTLRGYAQQGSGNRDTWYFREMFQRLMRALDYVKTIPEWDGRNLVIYADSMGAGQALVGAALDRDVSLCIAAIPAFGDLNGPAPGYPAPVKGAYSAYFDMVNFARLIRCPVHLSAGLIDFTTSPYSVSAIYNAIPDSTPKTLKLYPTLGHTGQCAADGVPDYLRLNRVMPAGKTTVPFEEPRSVQGIFRDWKFAVSPSGEWEKLEYRGISLIQGRAPMVLWQLGSYRKTPAALQQSRFDEKTGILKLSGQKNGFQLETIVAFDALSIPGMMESRTRLSRPADAPPAPVPFYGVSFQLPLDRALLLHAPGSMAGDRGGLTEVETTAIPPLERQTPRAGNSLRSGEAFTTASYTMPLQAELPQKQGSLLFLIDDRKEEGIQRVVRNGDSVLLEQSYRSCGWSYPGKVQEIGGVYLYVSPSGVAETLRSGVVHRWYSAIGLVPPANRPEWVSDAVMFETSPRFLASENGIAVMTASLLPKLEKMKFNTLWNMPVNPGGTYTPIDYSAINPVLGTPDTYRQMINRAHRGGMRVLQDTVPHGGTPDLARERGNSVFALRFHENGKIPAAENIGALAFNSAEWQAYLASAAREFRKLGADGFRIDQCGGSGPDWRRTDWPPRDRVPEGIDPQWWARSQKMDSANPPPYRASLSTRQGGSEVVGKIRAAARENHPDGAVLAETPLAVYAPSCDFLYDFMGRVWLHKFLSLSSAELVQGLANRLEEQYFTDPPGLLRMRYLELHDGSSATMLIGLNPARALTAILYLAHGVPLAGDVSGGFDIGNGPFLRRMNELRADNIALRRGIPDYRAVRCDTPEVFTVLRSTPEQRAVGAVNVSGSERTVRLTFPPGAHWYDAENGEPVAETILLKPWEARLFTDVPSGKKIAQRDTAASPAIPGGTLKWQRTGDGCWRVETPSYALAVRRQTGLIEAFGPRNQPDFCRNSLLLPFRSPKLKSDSAEKFEDGKLRLSSRVTFDGIPGKSLAISYICSPESVRMEFSADGFRREELMLLFSAPGVERWQADTADGRLDDFFVPYPAESVQNTRLPDPIHYEIQRYYLTPRDLLYLSTRVPLNWSSPEIRAFRNGAGICWRWENLLELPTAGISLHSRFLDRNDWHLGVAVTHDSPLTDGIPARFALTLRPIAPEHVAPEVPARASAGKLICDRDAGATRIHGATAGAVRFDRHGGGIAEWRNAQGKMQLRNLELASEGGYEPPISAKGDLRGGSVLFRDKGTLYFRTMTFPRNASRTANMTGLAALTQYAFPVEFGDGFFGTFQLIRRGGMPGKGGSFGIKSELAASVVTETDGRMAAPGIFYLPLLQAGTVFPAYVWGGTTLKFGAPSMEMPRFSLAPLAAPEPKTIERFDGFTIPASRIDADGKIRNVQPWSVNPPPRIAIYQAEFADGDRDATHTVLQLRSGASARIQLHPDRNAPFFGLTVRNPTDHAFRFDCQLIFEENGRERRISYPINLAAGENQWQQFRFPSPLPKHAGIASGRVRMPDVPGMAEVREIGFYPEPNGEIK